MRSSSMNNKKGTRKMRENKKEPKVTYAIRLRGYETILVADFESLRDARINRINLIKNARKSKDKWFKGKKFYPMVPHKSDHQIRNEWLRLSMLQIVETTVRYYSTPNHPFYTPTISSVTNRKVL